ncbi:unnamed protein product [Spirodela intermedia]|uniref:Uncharacterized protein n=1 Tax=Spirodela intermedia TaxID=51605 RepID=A0A7I8IC17_SPIIN|nr:unnamed protein product [Spirodela intermedia]CAA6655368.1 unnamed protein product [Spirodela intermedia]
MGNLQHHRRRCLLLLCFCCTSWFLPLDATELRTYIVHLHHTAGSPGTTLESKLEWHLSFLRQTTTALEEEEEGPSGRLVYSYRSAVNGFAARLSAEEVDALRRNTGVAAVHPDRRLELHTTYSHQFLGLGFSPGGAWANSGYGKGAIVGVLDTGSGPKARASTTGACPQCRDGGRGICQEGQSFNSSACNRKLIGARFYGKGHRTSTSEPGLSHVVEYVSPRDAHGHGTHTSSTAAGAVVEGASVLGVGAGVAAGMAPGAHVAVYKVCWFNGCYSSDILAGIDDAISDGVDDNIAIGAFRAMEKGVVVICAAGNNGPAPGSVANEAPWIVTVGASTMDRRFPAFVRMGNGQLLYGESLYPGNHFRNIPGREVELVYEDGGNGGGEFCFRGSLARARVGGKMVVCDRAGGAGMILANQEINQEEDSVDVHVLPTALVGYNESLRLKSYMKSTGRPVAQIEFGGTTVRRARGPAVALFSSRGPSLTDRSVIKPDLVAPGITEESTSAYSPAPPCPAHTSAGSPLWFALPTLVEPRRSQVRHHDLRRRVRSLREAHHGRREPRRSIRHRRWPRESARAMDPGLVYDIRPEDYVVHLCTLGYTGSEIFTVTHRNTSCREIQAKNRYFSLNYPSVSVVFKKAETTKIIQRRVTNVGPPNSTYIVRVAPMDGVRIRVTPPVLTFNAAHQSKSYRVWFQSKKRTVKGKTRSEEGDLTWFSSRNRRHRVRSPIALPGQGRERQPAATVNEPSI